MTDQAQRQAGFAIINLDFRFAHQQTFFFHHLSAFFANGHVHFLQGKNGAGKTTLLNIIQGNTQYLNGTLTGTFMLNGTELLVVHNQLPHLYTQVVGMVVQQVDTMLSSSLTVRENLQLACLGQYPGFGSLPHYQSFTHLLQPVGDIDQQVAYLSGGQRQILAILMMVQKPLKLLLLDEPTASLDPVNARMVIEFLITVAKQLNIVVIVISHDTELVMRYARDGYYQLDQEDNGQRTLHHIATVHSQK